MKTGSQLFEHTILIVDDEELNRTMLANILQSEYRLLIATDGKDALEKIRKEKDNLSLVMLDLLMPNMSGTEVLEVMSREGLLLELPVIVLTADKDSEIQSLKLGAADFLTKPYNSPEIIRARVRHAIQLFENTKLIHATEFDKLTLLYSPDFFFEYSSKFDTVYPDVLMDAVVINFTRFHLVNELKGRLHGDEVLNATADGIREVLKTYKGIACRYDADTFYVCIEHLNDYSVFIREISRQLTSLMKPSEILLRIGVYYDQSRSYLINQRFDYAVQACNSLRNKNGENICFYDKKMAEQEVFEATLLQSFEAAIEQKQFKVNYQPKFNITKDKPFFCSAEALVSWEHPELGRIRPDLFIPLFEKNGLIIKLDRYVWEEAARQIKKWKERLRVTIPVSVNVSRVDLAAPDMTEFICRIVRENELKPEEYMLEITESAYTQDSEHIIQVVEGLRALGHKIEMDDFGSGYSSLNMLTSMPIDALKMDKAFIRNIQSGNKDMKLVELVLDIAKDLEIPVIAEGVETEPQLQLLKKAGCDIIQGYYFSKPVAPEEFKKFL